MALLRSSPILAVAALYNSDVRASSTALFLHHYEPCEYECHVGAHCLTIGRLSECPPRPSSPTSRARDVSSVKLTVWLPHTISSVKTCHCKSSKIEYNFHVIWVR